MKKIQTRTKVRDRRAGKVHGLSNVEFGGELARTGVYTAGVFLSLIGVWSFACLFAGMVAGGGPVALIKNWFAAVAGL